MSHSKRIFTFNILIVFFAVVLSSCSGGAAPDILTTTTILTDITRSVVGDRFGAE
jgi:ABC-type Zn uptake system ZnuABC Zn-binding protein ZnuA